MILFIDRFILRWLQFIWVRFLSFNPLKYIERYLEDTNPVNEHAFLEAVVSYVETKKFEKIYEDRFIFDKHPFWFHELRIGYSDDFALYFAYVISHFQPNFNVFLLLLENENTRKCVCFVKTFPSICYSVSIRGVQGPVPSLSEVINLEMPDYKSYILLDKNLVIKRLFYNDISNNLL